MTYPNRHAAAVVAVSLVACAGAAPRPGTESPMSLSSAGIAGNPNFRFRIDSFSVPEASRAEFEAAMNRNFAYIQTLQGFRGHVTYSRAGGPTAFNVVTIATWESPEALERAGQQVRAYYRSIGFDPPAAMARWGVKAEIGEFQATPAPR